jgi:hypothetical protein
MTDDAHAWATSANGVATLSLAGSSASLAKARKGQDDVPGVDDTRDPGKKEETNVDKEVDSAASPSYDCSWREKDGDDAENDTALGYDGQRAQIARLKPSIRKSCWAV